MAKKKEFNRLKYLEIAAAKGEAAESRPLLSVGYYDSAYDVSVSADGYRLHLINGNVGNGSKFIEFKKTDTVPSDAEYVDYQSVISEYKTAPLEFSAHAGDIVRAVKRCRVFYDFIVAKAAESINNAGVVFYAKSFELGDCASIIDQSMGAKTVIREHGVEFIFRAKYFIDALSGLDDNDRVTVQAAKNDRIIISHEYGLAVIMSAKDPIYANSINADSFLDTEFSKYRPLDSGLKAARPKSKKSPKDVRKIAREKSSKNLVITEKTITKDYGTVIERTEYRRPASDFADVKHGKRHSEIIAEYEFAEHFGHKIHRSKMLPTSYYAGHLVKFDMPERAKDPTGFFLETAKTLIDNGAKVYTNDNMLAVRVNKNSAYTLRWSENFIYCYYETADGVKRMIAVLKTGVASFEFGYARRNLETMLAKIPVASEQVSVVR